MKCIKTCNHGFLKNYEDWNKNIALELSGLSQLSKEHIQILEYIRSFYKKNNTIPHINNILKLMNDNVHIQTPSAKIKMMNKFYRLYPKGLVNHAVKAAGIPYPKECI